MSGVVALSAPAYAPKYLGLPPQISGDCTLPSGETGTASGSFQVGRFDDADGKLAVSGMLMATCVTPSGPVGFNEVPVTTSADVYSATCDEFRFNLGAVSIRGVDFDLSRTSMDLIYDSIGDPPSLGHNLCTIARWQADGSLARRAPALTRMLVEDPMASSVTAARRS